MNPQPIPLVINQETISVLEGLLGQAKRGEVLGVACVSLHKHQRWGRVASGLAVNDPVIAIGALHVLLHDLTSFVTDFAE